MGEEATQEKPQTEEKTEVKKEEKKEENTEEKKEEPPKPPAPSPLILYLDLHCVGCAKKIEKSIMRMTGVEGVVTDMAQNQVIIKGTADPQAVCAKILKKTKRRAKVLSPLPPSEGEPIPEVINPEVSSPATVELNVNMHCEACAEQLKNKILKMKEVQTATADFSSGKVTVTGTMDANKLVDYVYRCTKKKAKIVPQPEPKPEKKQEEKPAEETKPENADEKKEEKPAEVEESKQGEGDTKQEPNEKKEEVILSGGESIISPSEEEYMKRMMHYYQPVYVLERIPPPQIFSDENPNACSIS